MPIAALSIENVTRFCDGNVARFKCANCEAEETVATYREGDAPLKFLLLAGFSGFRVKCYSCGAGGELPVDNVHG